MSAIPVINRQPGRVWTVAQASITRIVLGVIAIVVFVILFRAAFAAAHLRLMVAMGIPRAFIVIVGVSTIYVALVRGLERRRAVCSAPRSRAGARTGSSSHSSPAATSSPAVDSAPRPRSSRCSSV